MKHVNKLWVRIVTAIVIGFLFAGSRTGITYTCPLIDGAAGCVSFDKAIMHPSDLLNNKQDSLVRFSETFIITSLASFALLSISAWLKKSLN
ncbi:MAG: hypothetical protein M3Q79_01940 [bacterium]|nr:hypothetical protein [bacterium]